MVIGLRRGALMLALLALAGCGDGYDPPEQADPFDTIAPAPSDSAVVGSTGAGANSFIT